MRNRDPIHDFFGRGGLLARVLTHWEERTQQLEMALQVAAALELEQPLLVEAGTGTGKTLAYLVPAILSGKRVVVSTGTRSLQEQIFRKDVPFLREHLDVPFEAEVLKGISNYLCRRRLAALGDTSDPNLLHILAFAQTSESGDRAELAGVAEDAFAWTLTTTTPDARLGPRCPFYERCFVTKARRRAQNARIVIVNHHLFFADCALRAAWPGAAVLPPYDAVVFDEAHQVEDVATEHFGVSVSSLRFHALLRDAQKVRWQSSAALSTNGGTIAALTARTEELFAALQERLLRLGPERVPTPDDLFDGARREQWFRVDAALEALAARAARLDGEGDEDAGALARRAEALRADLASIAEPERARTKVQWSEVRGRAVFLHSSPVDVGELLRHHVFDPVPSTIMTSATLTARGSFEYLRQRLGLHHEADARELAIGSPFDYDAQVLLYLPRDLPAPKEPGFLEAALVRMVELCRLTAGRAFLLFTSHRALRQAASWLPARLDHPTLIQGESTPPALLDAFRQKPGSVLLGTSSFWEGVDVPGDALSLVVIEKLPFAPPDDPLTAARARAVEEAGQDPFMTYHVPRAALAVRQGFGRLIRRRDDRGIVAILDHRIVTRGYGRAFLESLPKVPRTSSLEQARRWFPIAST